MNIIDNAISKTDFTAIQDLMLSASFPWYFNESVLNPDNEQTAFDDLNDFQLTHSFYYDNGEYGYIGSEYFDLMKPIIRKLNSRCLLRIKANLRIVAPEKDMIAGWHTDYVDAYNMTTAIFYVNSNNGYTLFKASKKKVESVENRLLIFPTNLEHCGVGCTDNKQRIVINFNYSKSIGKEQYK